jgi:hypothetical protein
VRFLLVRTKANLAAQDAVWSHTVDETVSGRIGNRISHSVNKMLAVLLPVPDYIQFPNHQGMVRVVVVWKRSCDLL